MLKNDAAIKPFVKELMFNDSFDWETIRLHCKIVVYTCFLIEIEPHQLPLSEQYRGN
jgi:hypothetical protein